MCWLAEHAAISQPLLLVRRVIRRSVVRHAKLSDGRTEGLLSIGFLLCLFVCVRRKMGTVSVSVVKLMLGNASSVFGGGDKNLLLKT